VVVLCHVCLQAPAAASPVLASLLSKPLQLLAVLLVLLLLLPRLPRARGASAAASLPSLLRLTPWRLMVMMTLRMRTHLGQ